MHTTLEQIPTALLEILKRAAGSGLRTLSDQDLQSLDQAGFTRFKYPRGKQWTQKGIKLLKVLSACLEK